MAVSTVSFMILDIVKVFVIKNWSFEVTAKLFPVKSRRAELARRKGRAIIYKRVQGNWDKVRKISRSTILACSAFSNPAVKKITEEVIEEVVETIVEIPKV